MLAISVVMSIYNEKVEWIRESIDSILSQTYSDFEFIIINDNPLRKENNAILEEYKKSDFRISVIANDVNIGLTKSLNKGISIAKGKYIARMDADDISMPERFQKQIDYMESHPNCVVCGTDIKKFGDSNILLWDKKKSSDVLNKARLLYCSCFAHPSVFIRRSTLVENDILYDEEFKQAQDYRLWEQLYDLGEYHNIQENLLKYRVSSTQITKTSSSNQRNYANSIRYRLIRKWIKSLDKELEIPQNFTYLSIKEIRKNVLSRCKNKDDFHFFYISMQLFYFSVEQDKFRVLLYSFLKGDFFKMQFFDKIKFVFILLGLKNFKKLTK